MFKQINALLVVLIVTSSTNIFSQVLPPVSSQSTIRIDFNLLTNDKEELSLLLSLKERSNYIEMFSKDDQSLMKDAIIFATSEVKKDKNDKIVCDLGLINNFIYKLNEKGLTTSKEDIKKYLSVLRSNNSIDDIYYKLLLDLTDLNANLSNAVNSNKFPKNKDIKPSLNVFKNNNIQNLYFAFKTWPNEKDTCSLDQWVELKNKIKPTKSKVTTKDLRRLNAMAYTSGAISLDTYRKLEYFRKMKLLEKRKIFSASYLDKVLMAKNSLIPVSPRVYDLPVEQEDRFASRKGNIFRNVSMREDLYAKYDDEQLVMLAGVLRKASLRMGVDPDVQSSIPVISQNFTYLNERGEYVTYTETYELENASDQYDYARRRMRMDIHKLQTFKSFAGKKITYIDVVLAALETGYITHEEVELVLTYDDLWNKQESKLMEAIRFTFRIGSTAVFYLPPPYNIIGGIGVALINAKIIYRKDGSDYESPAALFN